MQLFCVFLATDEPINWFLDYFLKCWHRWLVWSFGWRERPKKQLRRLQGLLPKIVIIVTRKTKKTCSQEWRKSAYCGETISRATTKWSPLSAKKTWGGWNIALVRCYRSSKTRESYDSAPQPTWGKLQINPALHVVFDLKPMFFISPPIRPSWRLKGIETANRSQTWAWLRSCNKWFRFQFFFTRKTQQVIYIYFAIPK